MRYRFFKYQYHLLPNQIMSYTGYNLSWWSITLCHCKVGFINGCNHCRFFFHKWANQRVSSVLASSSCLLFSNWCRVARFLHPQLGSIAKVWVWASFETLDSPDSLDSAWLAWLTWLTWLTWHTHLISDHTSCIH